MFVLVTMPKKKVVLILLHLNFETIYFYAILRRNEGKKLSKRVSFSDVKDDAEIKEIKRKTYADMVRG